MASNILRSILKGRNQENAEEFIFEDLTASEKRTAIANSEFDIDFCLFCGLGSTVLQDTNINGILSNATGSIVARPYAMKIYGCPFSSIVVLANASPWKIGLCMPDTTEDDSAVVISDSESKPLRKKYAQFIMECSSRLGDTQGRNYPYRQLRDILLEQFSDFEMACFQFGQKQAVECFRSQFSSLSTGIKLFVALGMEIGLQDYFIGVTPEKIPVGECFYPMLFSQKIGSVVLPERHAKKFLSNSNRLVVYSTMHHCRKFTSHKFDLKYSAIEWNHYVDTASCINSCNSFLSCLKLFILEKLDLFQKSVHPMFRSSKLRVETYVELKVTPQGTNY